MLAYRSPTDTCLLDTLNTGPNYRHPHVNYRVMLYCLLRHSQTFPATAATLWTITDVAQKEYEKQFIELDSDANGFISGLSRV